ARIVAAPRPFDLDHFGTEVGEQLRAPRPGEHAAQVEDLDPVERLQWRRFQKRRSCRTARAALCPGAPVTPPPGCAPEPHRYSPAIGVRYCDQPATGRLKNSCSSVRSPWKMLPSVNP